MQQKRKTQAKIQVHTKRKMNDTFMKEKPIIPLVAKMSLPVVLSMIINALYNFVDSIFVSKISEDAMTAISLVFPVQNLSIAVGVGFGVGISAAVSFYMGAKKYDAANRSAALGLVLGTVHGVILAAVSAGCIAPFVKLFTKSDVISGYALDYFYVVVAFAPVITLTMAFEKLFQSVGKMKTTMFCMALGAVVNIALDPLFIFVAGWGVKGAAVATGIGQTLSLVCYIVLFFKTKLGIKAKLGKKTEEKIVKKLYFVGVPATLNLALPSFMLIALNGILTVFSETYMLILGVYYKLQTFLNFAINGIVQGIRPLVGYNLGAGRDDRVMSIFKVSLVTSLVIMVIGTILCLAIPSQLIGIFTDNPQTISDGAFAVRVMSAGFIVSASGVVICGLFEGLGMGIPSLVISIIRYVLIIPIALAASKIVGATGVWHAFWITEIIAFFVSWICFYFCYYKKAKVRIAEYKTARETSAEETLVEENNVE